MQTVMNEGSCSLVYLAHYEGTMIDENAVQRNVSLKLACKVMETEQAPKDFVQKFLLRELDIIAQISHPHIIHTHSILHLNTKILVFMRNAEYGNLCDYITNYGGLREKQARLWFRQLAVGVDYLHSINIAHRDIKCENILITSSLNVKICDFGFARFCADNKGKTVFSTTFCGSVAYAAPELIKGTPYVPMYSDVWSLGVVLYIMLNGIMPFRTDNIGKLWNTQMNKEYRFRTSVIPKTSREVIDLVSTMLEPNWFERTTLPEVLHSEWFAIEPSLLEFTPSEQLAMERAKRFHAENREKSIKKIMRTNRAKKIIEVISKESMEQPSDDMDDVIRKQNLVKGIKKVVNPSASNPVALKVTGERKCVQEGRRASAEGRRTSVEGRRASIDATIDTNVSERRASVDASQDTNVTEKAEATKDTSTS
ncbi:testis-specific serine/threonine-protein kinase 3 isoform X2 [Halyomorpha halys]|nr:testis-specific serine/threonine-protein kinase 2-like isoform X2 [Halyomorpha halys]